MIKRVRVVNYKCLGNVDVELGPVTILIGRSGTGKTTFVESLRFLRDYVAYRGDYALQFYGGWERILSATAQRPVTLSIEITFAVPGTEENYQYALTFQQPPQVTQRTPTPPLFQPALQEEKLALGSRTLFHHRAHKWVIQPRILTQVTPGSLVLGSLSGIPEVTRAHLFLTTGLGWYSFPDNVLLTTDNHPVHDPRLNVPNGHRSDTGLWDNGTNFLQAFSAITSNLRAWVQERDMVAALRQLNRSVAGLAIRVPNRDAIEVSHEIAGAYLPLELSQESEGLRRFLAFLIALYQNPPKETLIFEEPEKGIHPGALAVLADQFKACAAEGRGQILLTTHSPELLNHFEPETLRVVEIENYQTRIGPVAAEQVEAIREHLLHPGELLTVDPARVADLSTTQG
jgi:predicted ATPase